MKCPYCGKEMEIGVFKSPQEIAWTPKGNKRTLGGARFDRDAIVLSKLSLFKGSSVNAYACKDCKKIVIDYADETKES